VVRKKRRPPRVTYNRSPKLQGCPQRAGICTRVGTTKPKKPNSAIRKIAKVWLTNDKVVRAVIPGSGFNLQEHNTVLVRAGRVRDIPGVHYRLIRNQLDLGPPTEFRRNQRRSKFGVTNWAYVIRAPHTGAVLGVVCALRSKRHIAQAENNLPITWDRGYYRVRTRVDNYPTTPKPGGDPPPGE